MSVLDGVVQCWPLSSTCEVWWEAWAVVVAIAAAEVALLGAVAVAFLAYQANQLSQVSQRDARLQAESAERRDGAERARQERVILSFVNAELDGVITWARTCISVMEDDPNFVFDAYISKKSARKTLGDGAGDVIVENISRMLPNFHVCSPGVGLRLGRMLGDFYVTKNALARYEGWPNVGEVDDEFTVSREDWDKVFRLTLVRLRRIKSDAEHCAKAAFESSHQDLD